MGEVYPWVRVYMRDFESDTAEWSTREVGVYWRLLIHQWREGSIPNEASRLARICRCSTEDMEEDWPSISQKFKAVKGARDRLQNRRMERERREARERAERASQAGRASGKARSKRAYQVEIVGEE